MVPLKIRLFISFVLCSDPVEYGLQLFCDLNDFDAMYIFCYFNNDNILGHIDWG